MENNNMTTDEWQKRLWETFLPIGGGASSPALEDLRVAEVSIADQVRRNFHGTRTLTDSAFDFLTNTLVRAQYQSLALEEVVPSTNNFRSACVECTLMLRRMRAANSLLYSGYPFAGYALLRDVRDQALLVAAVMLGHTTFDRLAGFYAPSPVEQTASGTRINQNTLLKNRKKEENAILRKMRTLDNVSPHIEESLKKWDDLFDREVHGSKLTQTEFTPYLTAKDDLPVLPQYNEFSVAMYVNRISELQWMVHRILPCLQITSAGFGEVWKEHWEILDESFRFMILALKKDISLGIEQLVDTKFSFNVDSRYHE